MAIYLALFVVCVGILLLSKKDRALVISILILWAIFAFRDSVGVDDTSYIRAFENINIGWAFDIEWSYRTLALVASQLGFTYKLLFFLYATLSFIPFYKGIKLFFDTNIQRALFMACFFGLVFVSAISVMRQFLSACFCFYAVGLLYNENKLLKPLILCTVATLFHGGAIISIPILFLMRPNIHITYKAKIGLVIVSAVIGYSGLMSSALNMVMRFLPASYKIYSDSVYGSFSSAGGTLSVILLMMFVMQCFVSVRGQKAEPTDVMQIVIEKGQLIYLCLLFLFAHAGVASRLAFTYLIFSATIPLTMVKRIKKKDRFITGLLIIITMIILYVLAIQSVSSESGAVIPYNASLGFWK